MKIGIRSFNYKDNAYAAYALMSTSEKEVRNLLKTVEFEPDTHPDCVFLYFENPAHAVCALDYGYVFFSEEFPDIVCKAV